MIHDEALLILHPKEKILHQLPTVRSIIISIRMSYTKSAIRLAS
jgi:hypothetical protein